MILLVLLRAHATHRRLINTTAVVVVLVAPSPGPKKVADGLSMMPFYFHIFATYTVCDNIALHLES